MMEWLDDVDKKKEERLAWLKKRLGAITASDASCLYGANPYKTLEELYNEKIDGKIVDLPPNPAMARGIALEPILRKAFALPLRDMTGIDDPFDPAYCEHPEYKYIAASLDGLSLDKKYLIEIKYVGRRVLESRECPKNYWFQIQHQFLASGAERGCLVMGNAKDGSDVLYVEIPRDQSFINSHIILCQQFWANVLARKAPESHVAIVDAAEAIAVAESYKKLVASAQELETEIELARKELLKYAVKDETRIGSLSLKKIITKGSVSFKDIAALKDVDLELYRGPSRESWRITIDSKPLTDV